ncbi:MAG: glycosyltransferase [Candidatus Dojkabacteria bacterium]
MANKEQPKRIDIVITVYYATDLALRSIEKTIQTLENSEYTNSKLDTKIFVVDDTGDVAHNELLEQALKAKSLLDQVDLVFHEQNKGLIEACYTGISQRESDYKLIMNSDVIPVGNWLQEMLQVAESDASVAAVSPLTNNFPDTELKLPVGWNMHQLASHIEKLRVKPIELISASGFCMLYKDEYIRQFGFLDRIYGSGYCEEVDISMRLKQQGLKILLAPNAFVYHRGEASFTDRNERYAKNLKILNSRYQELIETERERFFSEGILLEEQRKIEQIKDLDMDVLVLSPNNSLLHGGVYVLHQIVNQLNADGIASSMCYLHEEKMPEQLEDYTYCPIRFHELLRRKFNPKLILYSLDSDSYYVARLAKKVYSETGKMPVVAQVLQDVEYNFWDSNKQAYEDYISLANVHFAVSPYVSSEVSALTSVKEIEVIKNKISLSIYASHLKYKSKSKLDGAEKKPITTIGLMYRNDEKRGGDVILAVLSELEKAGKPLNIEFHVYGGAEIEKKFKNFKVVSYGKLAKPAVVELLTNVDVFVEASKFQGFGLAAFEALICGCELVSSDNEGAISVLPDSTSIRYFENGNYKQLAKILSEIAARDGKHKRTNGLKQEQIIEFSMFMKGSEYSRFVRDKIEGARRWGKDELDKKIGVLKEHKKRHEQSHPHRFIKPYYLFLLSKLKRKIFS